MPMGVEDAHEQLQFRIAFCREKEKPQLDLMKPSVFQLKAKPKPGNPVLKPCTWASSFSSLLTLFVAFSVLRAQGSWESVGLSSLERWLPPDGAEKARRQARNAEWHT